MAMYAEKVEKLTVILPFDTNAETSYSGEIEIEGEDGYPAYTAYIEASFDPYISGWDIWVGDVYKCLDAENHLQLWGIEKDEIEQLIKQSI